MGIFTQEMCFEQDMEIFLKLTGPALRANGRIILEMEKENKFLQTSPHLMVLG